MSENTLLLNTLFENKQYVIQRKNHLKQWYQSNRLILDACENLNKGIDSKSDSIFKYINHTSKMHGNCTSKLKSMIEKIDTLFTKDASPKVQALCKLWRTYKHSTNMRSLVYSEASDIDNSAANMAKYTGDGYYIHFNYFLNKEFVYNLITEELSKCKKESLLYKQERKKYEELKAYIKKFFVLELDSIDDTSKRSFSNDQPKCNYPVKSIETKTESSIEPDPKIQSTKNELLSIEDLAKANVDLKDFNPDKLLESNKNVSMNDKIEDVYEEDWISRMERIAHYEEQGLIQNVQDYYRITKEKKPKIYEDLQKEHIYLNSEQSTIKDFNKEKENKPKKRTKAKFDGIKKGFFDIGDTQKTRKTYKNSQNTEITPILKSHIVKSSKNKKVTFTQDTHSPRSSVNKYKYYPFNLNDAELEGDDDATDMNYFDDWDEPVTSNQDKEVVDLNQIVTHPRSPKDQETARHIEIEIIEGNGRTIRPNKRKKKKSLFRESNDEE